MSDTVSSDGSEHGTGVASHIPDPDLIVAFAMGVSMLGKELRSLRDQKAKDKFASDAIEGIEAELRQADDLVEYAVGRLTRTCDPERPITPLKAALDQLSRAGLIPVGGRIELVAFTTDPSPEGSVVQAAGTQAVGKMFANLTKHAERALGPFSVTTSLISTGQFGDPMAVRHMADGLEKYHPSVMTIVLAGPGSFNMAWDIIDAVTQTRSHYGILDAEGEFWQPNTTAPEVAANWLLRYGQPALARDILSTLTADVDKVSVQRRAEQFDRLARNQGSADDLAEWVRKDLRLRDICETLAFRAWVEAEYRARFERESCNDPEVGRVNLLDLMRTENQYLGLGTLINNVRDEIKRGRLEAYKTYRRASTDFLCESLKAVKASGKSAHCQEYLDLKGRNTILGRLGSASTSSPAEAPPSGRVAWIWPVGLSERGYAHDFAGHDFSALAATYQPDGDGLKMEALLVASNETADAAKKAVESLEAKRAEEWLLAGIGIQSSGTKFAACGLPLATVKTRTGVYDWLSRMKKPVDAIVLPAVGNRSQALGILQAAITFASERAVPVYIAHTKKGVAAVFTPVELRTLARATGLEVPILRAVGSSVHALNWNAAQRMATLLGPGYLDLLPRIAMLKKLFEPTRSETDRWVTCAQLAICRRALDRNGDVQFPSPDGPAKARIVHIAAEFARHAREGGQSWTRIRPRHGGSGGTPYRRLLWARDGLQVNHGVTGAKGDVDDIINAVLRAKGAARRSGGGFTARGVVQGAADACKSTAGGAAGELSLVTEALGAWDELMGLLEKSLKEATGSEAQHQALMRIVTTP